MNLVIDSNCLQTPDLRSFLAKSPSNRAVLTDFAALEAYKGDTLTSIQRSMEIVSQFPSQVVVLKNSTQVARLRGRASGLRRRLIDERQTTEFTRYVRGLRLAQAGNLAIQNELLSHGRFAENHLARMLEDAKAMGVTFDQLGAEYSKAEREILRARDAYTPEMAKKLFARVLDIAAEVFASSPLITKSPSHAELPNTFLFRVTLACYVLALLRSAESSVAHMRPDKVRNDIVDMTFVAYGTFFDGVLSKDDRVNKVFEEVCILLSALFQAVVPKSFSLPR